MTIQRKATSKGYLLLLGFVALLLSLLSTSTIPTLSAQMCMEANLFGCAGGGDEVDVKCGIPPPAEPNLNLKCCDDGCKEQCGIYYSTLFAVVRAQTQLNTISGPASATTAAHSVTPPQS